jgi:hypothetical protein
MRAPSLLLATALLLPAADSVDQVRKEIIACYDRGIEALRRGDTNAAAQCDTDDWVSITVGQQPVTRKENDARIRKYIAEMKPPPGWSVTWKPDYEHTGTTSGIQIYDLNVDSDSAVVLYLIGGSRTETIDGVTHTKWQGSHIRDTWIKTSAGWKRRKHEKLTVNERMVDGRTIQP